MWLSSGGSVKSVKMLRQGVSLVFFAIVGVAIAKPPPPGTAPGASYDADKSFYSRALGPAMAPAMSAITVPYMPKASPFFPKFVDPQAMIAKKTDMLTNLFGGLGPVNYPALFPYQMPPKPLLYATNEEENPELEGILGPKETGDSLKRKIKGPPAGAKFGPMGPDSSPFASKFGSMGPKFGPFSPKFGGMGPKFSPFDSFPGYGSKFPSDDAPASTYDTASRKKRDTGDELVTSRAVGPPPPYPGLGTIPEEPETEAGAPKQYLPGMFGPFGPFGAFGPAVDPNFFITKKTTFLDTLFKNLATSTPAPPDTVTDPTAPKPTIVPPNFWVPFNMPTETLAPATALPVPKSTIVPADYWLPSSVIPGPTEYTDKVSKFLDKLFDSLKLNKTMTPAPADSPAFKGQFTRAIADEPETAKFTRSLEDLQSIAAAKDAIVDSIIKELSSIKGDMQKTMNDLIVAQKTSPAASPFAKKPMKPGKPASPWAAMFAPPVVDPAAPFKQKMNVLSQVFDMLTGLQKNITVAIQDSVKQPATEAPVAPPSPFSQFNATLLDAIKTKLDSLSTPMMAQPKPFTTFWGSPYSKRNVDDDDYYNYHDHDNREQQFKRGVKMTMHQGYQSMPPGTIETVQAGGGSVPGHQGGGIKLYIQMPSAGHQVLENEKSQENEYENYGKQWADWAEYMKGKNQDEGHRHHHNHH